MGEDFEYGNALYNYYSVDNLIQATNEYDQGHTSNFVVKYSTPSEYIQSLKDF